MRECTKSFMNYKKYRERSQKVLENCKSDTVLNMQIKIVSSTVTRIFISFRLIKKQNFK